jgi:hypothetical protein
LQQIPCRAEQGIFLAAAGNFLGGAGKISGGAGEFREFTADWFHGIDLLVESEGTSRLA